MTSERRARLSRLTTSDEGTFGVIAFGDQHARSLELPWLDNRRMLSCIPTGDYLCRPRKSLKFGEVYEVTGVPGRSAILIHSANLAGSTASGWQTQLLGCIAPYEFDGKMKNVYGNWQRAGLNSKTALRRLMAWAGGRRFVLTINWSE